MVRLAIIASLTFAAFAVAQTGDGTQFIGGPCTSDADCLSSCCSVDSDTCASALVAEEGSGCSGAARKLLRARQGVAGADDGTGNDGSEAPDEVVGADAGLDIDNAPPPERLGNENTIDGTPNTGTGEAGADDGTGNDGSEAPDEVVGANAGLDSNNAPAPERLGNENTIDGTPNTGTGEAGADDGTGNDGSEAPDEVVGARGLHAGRKIRRNFQS